MIKYESTGLPCAAQLVSTHRYLAGWLLWQGDSSIFCDTSLRA